VLVLDLVEGRILERQAAGGGQRVASQRGGRRRQDGLRKRHAERGGNDKHVWTVHGGFSLDRSRRS
jgi:hypothetical protein